MTDIAVPRRAPWKTMLVPTDFSSGSRAALSLAADLAKVHGARLVVLHVAELLPGLTADTMVHAEGGGAPLRLEDFHRAQSRTARSPTPGTCRSSWCSCWGRWCRWCSPRPRSATPT